MKRRSDEGGGEREVTEWLPSPSRGNGAGVPPKSVPRERPREIALVIGGDGRLGLARVEIEGRGLATVGR